MPARLHRVTAGKEYRHIVKTGSRVGGAFAVTHAVLHSESEQPARFGFIISKAVGNAVTRNLVRRRMKHIVELRLARGFYGADVVFRMLPTASGASYADLSRQINHALDRVSKMPQHPSADKPTN